VTDRSVRRRGSGLFDHTKVFEEKLPAPFLALFGQHDGFSLSDRIKDNSIAVQSPQCIPVVAFPGATIAALSEKKQRKHSVIDFVFVVLHAHNRECFEARVDPSSQRNVSTGSASNLGVASFA